MCLGLGNVGRQNESGVSLRPDLVRGIRLLRVRSQAVLVHKTNLLPRSGHCRVQLPGVEPQPGPTRLFHLRGGDNTRGTGTHFPQRTESRHRKDTLTLMGTTQLHIPQTFSTYAVGGEGNWKAQSMAELTPHPFLFSCCVLQPSAGSQVECPGRARKPLSCLGQPPL